MDTYPKPRGKRMGRYINMTVQLPLVIHRPFSEKWHHPWCARLEISEMEGCRKTQGLGQKLQQWPADGKKMQKHMSRAFFLPVVRNVSVCFSCASLFSICYGTTGWLVRTRLTGWFPGWFPSCSQGFKQVLSCHIPILDIKAAYLVPSTTILVGLVWSGDFLLELHFRPWFWSEDLGLAKKVGALYASAATLPQAASPVQVHFVIRLARFQAKKLWQQKT